MYAQQVKVTFADGTATETTLTQWSMGQFGQYAQTRGWSVDMQNPGLLAVVMLRYQAYCELHRDPQKPRAAFEKWDFTVLEVEPLEEPAAVDPTDEAPSGD